MFITLMLIVFSTFAAIGFVFVVALIFSWVDEYCYARAYEQARWNLENEKES